MKQYIDKAAVVAEIEKRMQELHPTNTHKMQVGEMDRDVLMWLNALTWVKSFLNTIEVKEVDLEKEKDDYWNKLCDSEFGELLERDAKWFDDIAKHFFELGLKTKGGEK